MLWPFVQEAWKSFCVCDISLNSSEEMCLKLIACVKGRCQNNMYDFCRHSFYLAMIMTSAQWPMSQNLGQ